MQREVSASCPTIHSVNSLSVKGINHIAKFMKITSFPTTARTIKKVDTSSRPTLLTGLRSNRRNSNNDKKNGTDFQKCSRVTAVAAVGSEGWFLPPLLKPKFIDHAHRAIDQGCGSVKINWTL